MGFPRVVGSKSGKVILSDSFDISIPSGVQAGQTIFVIVASTTSNTTTLTDESYTELVNEQHSDGLLGVQLCIWYKRAAGNEVSLTIDLDGATAAYVYNVLLIDNLSDFVPRVSDVVEGASAEPNSGEISLGTPSNTLWLSVAAIDSRRDVRHFPENYDLLSFYSSTAVGPTLAMAGYNFRAISEDPGSFYLDLSDEWLSATIGFISNITTWTRFSSMREPCAGVSIWRLPNDDEHVFNTGSPEDLLIDPEDVDIEVARVQEHATVWLSQIGTPVDWTAHPIPASEFYVSEI